MFVIILQNSILRDPDMFEYKYIISTLVINYIHLNKQTENNWKRLLATWMWQNVGGPFQFGPILKQLAEKAKISILFFCT